MKVWVLLILHSYMILEHFYTICNTFMQFPYTLIWFWTLLYDPKINKNFILVIPFFNHLFSVKKGITGMKFLNVLLYDPKINKNFILVIPFFNHLFSVKKGITGMKFLV